MTQDWALSLLILGPSGGPILLVMWAGVVLELWLKS
jgi:hypothetical protein